MRVWRTSTLRTWHKRASYLRLYFRESGPCHEMGNGVLGRRRDQVANAADADRYTVLRATVLGGNLAFLGRYASWSIQGFARGRPSACKCAAHILDASELPASHVGSSERVSIL